MDGYLADVHFIDGTALTASSFGEFDDNGVWVPIAYSGSYGTNGFQIQGATASALGDDTSGNANDYTTSGLTTADQMLDSPTDDAASGVGNFNTWNPVDAGTGTLSDGNLTITGGTVDRSGTFGMSSGKWAWKLTADETKAYGLVQGSLTGTESTYSATATNVLEFEFDADAGTLDVSVNGAAYSSVATGLTSGPYFTLAKGNCSSVDFGQSGFTQDDTTFKYLCTANLPAPAIPDGSAHFQTTLYTGNGTAIGSGGNAITQSENSTFQPDFVWIKNRDAADSHMLYDAVRGVTKDLNSDNTSVEATDTEGLSTFDTSGFTVGSNVAVNTNTENYAAWQWFADNTSGASNTDGSITSTVAANTTTGFSIATYTGTGANATIGHGLSAAPELLIVRNLADTFNWLVYHNVLTATDNVRLNQTNATKSQSTIWNDTEPTSTVFSVGTNTATNASSGNHVCYAWHSVEGFSKFGSYTGNGSTTEDGPFIHLGFKPAFIMLKPRNVAGSWLILDNARDNYNEVDKFINADDATAEAATPARGVDFLSNGFKFRATINGDWQQASQTYIYAAFAEHPFGGDGAAQARAR